MKTLACVAAVAALLAATPAAGVELAPDESPAALMVAADAVAEALDAAAPVLEKEGLEPGSYWWNDDAPSSGAVEVRISIADQLAFVYRGGELIGVASVSTGKAGKDTPPGIFPILEKKTFHRSRKYDDAPMPFMQRLDNFGIALHAGANPGYPASHGCIRLPSGFAKKLFAITRVGDRVTVA